MIHGSIPALITPFRNGGIDEKAFQNFIEWQIAEGSNAIVPAGTTGESPTLSHDEHNRIIELAVEAAAGRVPVVAGTGSNNTIEAIAYTQHAHKVGADAALVVAPYYNKPSQEGLYQHFKTVAECADIPIIMYNVPARTIADISVETMARLAKDVSNIIGVKDATASLDRVSSQRRECGKEFIQVSGEDGTALGFNAHGGTGCISVTANVAPRLCSKFQAACAAGDYQTALSIQDELMPLHEALFADTSPGPVKYAVCVLGKSSEQVRLPLVTISDGTKQLVRDAMVHAGLIN